VAKILWLDDNITTTDMVSEVLHADGHDVTTRPFLDENVPSLSDFDLVVIDLFMDRATRGGRTVDFGLNYLIEMLNRNRRSQEAVESGRTLCLLLSQHLADYDLRESIKDLTERHDIRAYLRSKNQSLDPDLPRREAIAGIIEGVVASGRGPKLSEEVERMLQPPRSESFFDISLADFRELEESVQAELQEKALSEAEPEIAAYFNSHEDIDWVILCGKQGVIKSGASGTLPAALDRRAIADRCGHPLLVVTRRESTSLSQASSVVEELQWLGQARTRGTGNARCEGVMNDYPVLFLRLANVDRSYHFDTGSDSNFLRASHAREHGVELYIEDRIRGSSRFGRYYIYELPREGVDCVLVDDRSGDHIGVRVEGYAIEQFRNWTYARRCYESQCLYGLEGEPCAVRSGLIGRRFLGDNQLAIEINPASDYTRLWRI